MKSAMDKDLSNPRTLELITKARSDSPTVNISDNDDADDDEQMLLNELTNKFGKSKYDYQADTFQPLSASSRSNSDPPSPTLLKFREAVMIKDSLQKPVSVRNSGLNSIQEENTQQ